MICTFVGFAFMDVVILVFQNDLTGMEHNVFVPIAKGALTQSKKLALPKKKFKNMSLMPIIMLRGFVWSFQSRKWLVGLIC